MITERPIEIGHLPPHLRKLFTGKISEATSGTAESREANFLSRALAAYALHILVPCTVDVAAQCVVDGVGDGGIDAIHYSPSSHVLWVVQSKHHQDGLGEPDLGSVSKFKNGLESLLQGKYDAFEQNQAWKNQLPTLRQAFDDSLLRVRALLVYTGIHQISDDRIRIFEDLRNRFSADCDYLEFKFCNLQVIHDWIVGAHLSSGVQELKFTLLEPGWVKEPYETVYGLLPLTELAQLYKEHGKKLITTNIRGYKGDTDVNEEIAKTAKDEPAHFFYLNNGLTAYCERFVVANQDRANAQKKRITAFGISIVNGAQTSGSIASCVDPAATTPAPGNVFIKVISLEKCQTKGAFAKRITHSTNFQNQIGSRDFAALDEQQVRISNQLLPAGISYHYKDSEDTPASDSSNFTLEEATTACASLVQTGDGDFCARILANRKSLWSLEEVYPANDLYRSRYSKVFRPDRSARTVWRAVQVQRVTIQALKTNEGGIRKAFFENCRWLILNVLLLKLRSEQGEAVTLSAEELNSIPATALDYAEKLWTICQAKGFVTSSPNEGWKSERHFRSIFSTPGDCALLRSALLAMLATIAPSANTPATLVG